MARHGGIGPYSAENLYCTMQSADVINVTQKAKMAGDKRCAATAMATCRLAGPWEGIRNEGHSDVKTVVARPAASGSAALAAKAHEINPAIASLRARGRSC